MNPVPGVAEVQEWFQSYVLERRPVIENAVVADAKADAPERLKVYAEAYRSRLLEVLGKDYPALRAMLGEAEFHRLGSAYIDAHPSSTPSVRWFGRHLARYLKQEAPRRAVLSELAAFEWAQGEVFDAPDATVLSVEDIARIPASAWPGLRLVLHPAQRRLDLVWNVPAIAQAVAAAAKPPRPTAGPARVVWLLWRHVLDIRWRSLEPGEADALDAAHRGATFGEICERIGARIERIESGQAALYAASLLKRWVADGLVAAVETS